MTGGDWVAVAIFGCGVVLAVLFDLLHRADQRQIRENEAADEHRRLMAEIRRHTEPQT